MTGLWLLADSRLPTGGHVHSGGIEGAVRRGLVTTPDDVAAWLAGRIPTTGLVTAATAAAARVLASPVRSPASPVRSPARGEPSVALSDRTLPSSDDLPPRGEDPAARSARRVPSRAQIAVDWAAWDAALSARTPVAALREASRAQGRAMLRTVRVAWPHAMIDGLGPHPHQALVLGVATAAADGSAHDAAALAVHHLVGQVCSAGVRLLGLDPLALAGVHARALEEHAGVVDESADAGVRAALAGEPDHLPTATSPLPEVLAVLHARSEGALFAS